MLACRIFRFRSSPGKRHLSLTPPMVDGKRGGVLETRGQKRKGETMPASPVYFRRPVMRDDGDGSGDGDDGGFDGAGAQQMPEQQLTQKPPQEVRGQSSS
jgi:hypothetical protein